MSLIIKQLRAGRDFAKGDLLAGQMANFVYVIADDAERVCMLVDPAWDVKGLLEIIDAEGFELTGVLATHYHPDHVGGSMFGYQVDGLAELMSLRPVKVHVEQHEAEGVIKITGLSPTDIVRRQGGDRERIGSAEVTFVHTPGHTPGSQCFLVENELISGDTLFIGGCGRVDLPGGDAEQMYFSLTQVLGRLPDATRVLPGHDYSTDSVSTIGKERRTNTYLSTTSIEDWRRKMGRVFTHREEV